MSGVPGRCAIVDHSDRVQDSRPGDRFLLGRNRRCQSQNLSLFTRVMVFFYLWNGSCMIGFCNYLTS